MKGKSAAENRPMILIAEDNRINQLILLKKLAQRGFRNLLLAKNGQEAIALALKNNPDLILMDIQLPDMNGNEAIQSLRNKKFTGPIVAVSADTSPADINASSAAGANGHISKPIDFSTFFSQIGRFIEADAEQTVPARPDTHSDKIDPSISAAAKNVFITDAQEKIQILTTALENSSAETQLGKIKAIAHEYKGNAGYFGLKELARIARELDMSFSDDQAAENQIKLTRQLLTAVKGIIDESS